MVGCYMSFENFHLMFSQMPRISDLALWAMSPDKIFFRYLGHPDQVQDELKNTVGTFAIIAHAHRLQRNAKAAT